jgi:magnesium chelatase family protein
MLARRLTTILPAMTLAEAIQTTRLHSGAGLTSDRAAMGTTRPYHTSRYNISNTAVTIGSLVKTVTWPSR